MKTWLARVALMVVAILILGMPLAHAYPLRNEAPAGLTERQTEPSPTATETAPPAAPTPAPTPTPSPTVAPPIPDPIVQTTITASYNRRRHRIGGFLQYTGVNGHWTVDDEECLHDRVVKLYRSRKVNGVWRDTLISKGRTERDGFFGWTWGRNSPPSAWWNITVAKASFSGRYGDLIVCGYAQLAQRIKT